MKHLRLICSVFIVPVLLFSICVSVFATDVGLTTEPVLENEAKDFLNNVGIELLAEEPQKRPVECFNVSNNGLVAIGSYHLSNKVIAVYNESGQFQYGYRFNCWGSFGIDWNVENIVICFVRSDMAVEVDANGAVLSVSEISNTTENNTYWNSFIDASKKTVKDKEYISKNKDFTPLSTNSTLVVSRNAAGEETVIYDATTDDTVIDEFTVTGIAVSFFVTMAIILQIYKERKKEKSNP